MSDTLAEQFCFKIGLNGSGIVHNEVSSEAGREQRGPSMFGWCCGAQCVVCTYSCKKYPYLDWAVNAFLKWSGETRQWGNASRREEEVVSSMQK